MIRAVVFDLDGVLLDSEQLWDEARRHVVARRGGHWRPGATAAMQGMSAPEWSRYLRGELSVPLDPAEIDRLVVDDLLDRYHRDLPLVPGAREVVERLAQRWPLALASSSNRTVIEEVLAIAGLTGSFAVVVSSEEVQRGKPAADVYLEAARRLGRPPRSCAAVEDSANGIRAAVAAGMPVVAVPNTHYPPPAEVLKDAVAVVGNLDGLTITLFERLGADDDHLDRLLDEEEVESFPASDPHSDWAGPPL